jgi:hypothetical protein
MSPLIRTLTAAALTLIAMQTSAQDIVYKAPQKGAPARVTIYALNNYVHQAFAGNEDIYLADVTFKNQPHQTARLVDLYSGYGSPIRHTLLAERRLFEMRLIRTPDCDTPARSMLLGTYDRNIFDQGARTALAGDPEAAIPCFRIIHEDTKIVKK